MEHRISKIFLKVMSVMLVVVMVMPSQVLAIQPEENRPMASYYIDSYSADIERVGGGKIQINYDVLATNFMDTLGALTIVLYESNDNSNWNYVKTFKHTEYSSMIAHDDIYYYSYVEYQGMVGRFYKAYVSIWAGDANNGDTRYVWTPSVQAIR